MKKIVASITVFAFMVVLAGMVYSQAPRTLEQELTAIRAYLKLLDLKIIKHRNLGNKAVVLKLQAEKKATIARGQKVKAQIAAAAAPPPPPPPPIAPAPPPPPVAPAPPPPAGLFGMGLMTSVDIGYIAGDGDTASVIGGGSIILSDPMAIGTMFGLTADAVKYKIGIGGTYGKDRNDNTFNAILVTFDSILNIPEEALGGVGSYIGGQVNYPVYKTEVTGKIGALLYAGLKGDIGLGGKSYIELGYGAIRREGFSTKGVDIKIGQEILL